MGPGFNSYWKVPINHAKHTIEEELIPLRMICSDKKTFQVIKWQTLEKWYYTQCPKLNAEFLQLKIVRKSCP